MSKPLLKAPFGDLEAEMIRTFIAGLKQWRPDLAYPESHSDMQAGVRALLKRFEITARAVPLDWREIEHRDEHRDDAARRAEESGVISAVKEWPCAFSHHNHATRDEAVECAKDRR